jgi:hypothetical protein
MLKIMVDTVYTIKIYDETGKSAIVAPTKLTITTCKPSNFTPGKSDKQAMDSSRHPNEDGTLQSFQWLNLKIQWTG